MIHSVAGIDRVSPVTVNSLRAKGVEIHKPTTRRRHRTGGTVGCLGDRHRLTPSHEEHLELSARGAENDPDRSLGRPSRVSGNGGNGRSRHILPVADFQTGLSLAPGTDYSSRTENREEHQDS